MMPPGWPQRFPELPAYDELRAMTVVEAARVILPVIKELDRRSALGITPRDAARAIATDRYASASDDAPFIVMRAITYLIQQGFL